MGCAQSRDDKRIDGFGADYTLVPYGFRAALKSNFAVFFPIDKLVVDYIGEGKDIGESALGEVKEGKFANADELKNVAGDVFGFLKTEHASLKKNTNEKENALFQKYKVSEALADVEGVLTIINGVYSDLKWPLEDAKTDDKKDGDDKKDDDKKEDEAAGEGNEGGDANFAEAIVGAYAKHGYFADLIKSNVLRRELEGGFNILAPKIKLSIPGIGGDDRMWKSMAAILCIYVNAKESDGKDKEIWASCRISAADAEELKEAADKKDNHALIFPGVTVWHADEAAAKGAVKGPEAHTQVTFQLKDVNYADINGSFLISRFFGLIEEVAENTYKLSEFKDGAHETIKAFNEWKDKAAAAGAAAAGAAGDKPADDKKDGDDKPADDAGDKKDGE